MPQVTAAGDRSNRQHPRVEDRADRSGLKATLEGVTPTVALLVVVSRCRVRVIGRVWRTSSAAWPQDVPLPPACTPLLTRRFRPPVPRRTDRVRAELPVQRPASSCGHGHPALGGLNGGGRSDGHCPAQRLISWAAV